MKEDHFRALDDPTTQVTKGRETGWMVPEEVLKKMETSSFLGVIDGPEAGT